MARIYTFVTLAACLAIGGCIPTGEDELKVWMAEQRATTKPRVTPLTEPKKFSPERYTADGNTEPFSPVKLVQALRRDSVQLASNAALIAPEMTRRKEPLEAFPLDAMTMVGSLNKSGSIVALLKVDNLLYQVRKGDYIGQSYGKITGITESSIGLREIIQDPSGDWIERSTALELQEGKK